MRNVATRPVEFEGVGQLPNARPRMLSNPIRRFFVRMENLLLRPIYLGGHRSLVPSIYGDQFYVDTRDRSVGRCLLVWRQWEPNVTRVLREHIGPGDIVVDVGANLGWHTVMMGQYVGREGRVFSFEANPGMIDLLGRNIQINDLVDRIEVIPKAVFSTNGEVTLQVFGELLGSASLFGTEGNAIHHYDTVRGVTVEAIRLDDHFAPGSRVDLIHADIEGSEAHLVRGAKRVIRENSGIVLILEYAPALLNSSGISTKEFNEELRELGLRPHRINERGRAIATSFEKLETVGHCDIMLCR